ncbi:MAG: S-methyl-5'-thioadenosine phosphorylase [Candidatus Aureabacteria bacterium]|nr:S-methyl-5'-thioadenosine phosphorylase [Candidatus Auribacterota bacterium]
MMAKIGIIGGSGLYKVDGISGIKEIKLETPFGLPSDNFITGKIDGFEVVFLPRHGRSHDVIPSDINYRANIYGMKNLGVEKIVSFGACGSLKENIKPGDFLIPDQLVDRTNSGRRATFFGEGIVAHIPFAEPFCNELRKVVYDRALEAGIATHNKGTYINIEGPAFSTKAESHLYRSWGMDVIGMTNLVEAKLAREAEICYCTVAMVTDYDCWYPGHESVTVEMIVECMNKNSSKARNLVKTIVPELAKRKRACQCGNALATSIITPKEAVPGATLKKLDIIIGKYLK